MIFSFEESRLLRFALDGDDESQAQKRREDADKKAKDEAEKKSVELNPKDMAEKAGKERSETTKKLEELAKKFLGGLSQGNKKTAEVANKESQERKKAQDEQRSASEKQYGEMLSKMRTDRSAMEKQLQALDKQRKADVEARQKFRIVDSDAARTAAAESVIKSINAVPFLRDPSRPERPEQPVRPDRPEAPGPAPERASFDEGDTGDKEFKEAVEQHSLDEKAQFGLIKEYGESLRKYELDESRHTVAVEVFEKMEKEFQNEIEASSATQQMSIRLMENIGQDLIPLGEQGIAVAMREYRAAFASTNVPALRVYTAILARMLPQFPQYWQQILEMTTSVEELEELEGITLLLQAVPVEFTAQLCTMLDGRYLDRLYPSLPPALQKSAKEYLAANPSRTPLELRSVLYRLQMQTSPEQQRGMVIGMMRAGWEISVFLPGTRKAAEEFVAMLRNGDPKQLAEARTRLQQMTKRTGRTPAVFERNLLSQDADLAEGTLQALMPLLLRERMQPYSVAALPLASALRDAQEGLQSASPDVVKKTIAGLEQHLATFNKAIGGSRETAEYMLVAALGGPGELRERALQEFAMRCGYLLEWGGNGIVLTRIATTGGTGLSSDAILGYVMNQSNPRVRDFALDSLHGLLPTTSAVTRAQERGLLLLQVMMRPRREREGEDSQANVKSVIEAFRRPGLSPEALTNLATVLAGSPLGVAALVDALNPQNTLPIRRAAAEGLRNFWMGEFSPFGGDAEGGALLSASVPAFQLALRDADADVRARGLEALVEAMPIGTVPIESRLDPSGTLSDRFGRSQRPAPLPAPFQPVHFRADVLAMLANAATTSQMQLQLIDMLGYVGEGTDAPLLLKRLSDASLSIDNRLDILDALIRLERNIMPSTEHRALVTIAQSLAELHQQLTKGGRGQQGKLNRVRIMIAQLLSSGLQGTTTEEAMKSALEARTILVPVLRTFVAVRHDEDTDSQLFSRFRNLPVAILAQLINDADPALARRAVQLSLPNVREETNEGKLESLLKVFEARAKTVRVEEEVLLATELNDGISRVRGRLNELEEERKKRLDFDSPRGPAGILRPLPLD